MDAKLPFILVEALKRDLDLSDSQLGLITGPAFSLSYALFAIPISKLSDAKNRVVIISSAIVVWSEFTAFGGLAKNFVTFGFSRIGVALGEAEQSARATCRERVCQNVSISVVAVEVKK